MFDTCASNQLSQTVRDDTCSATVDYTVPAATDNTGASIPVNCNPSPGSSFQIGNTTVICEARDSNGNQSLCELDITVGKPHSIHIHANKLHSSRYLA